MLESSKKFNKVKISPKTRLPSKKFFKGKNELNFMKIVSLSKLTEVNRKNVKFFIRFYTSLAFTPIIKKRSTRGKIFAHHDNAISFVGVDVKNFHPFYLLDETRQFLIQFLSYFGSLTLKLDFSLDEKRNSEKICVIIPVKWKFLFLSLEISGKIKIKGKVKLIVELRKNYLLTFFSIMK
jgi:hypothetical protein